MTDQQVPASTVPAAAPHPWGVGRFVCRDRQRWDRAVCRMHGLRCDWSTDPPAIPSVFSLDNEMCAVARDNPRHRERWEPTLDRMKGDWLACAGKGERSA